MRTLRAGKALLPWALLGGSLLASPSTFSCTVPTFLYALENWPPDPYEVLVFHKGGLAGEALRAYRRLKRASFREGGTANIVVREIDLSGSPGQLALKVWRERPEGASLPWVVALYPPNITPPRVAWQGPLTTEAVSALLDSPARRKIANRLIEGDAVVWVVLESGRKAKDDLFVKRLKGLLKRMEGEVAIRLLDPVTGEEWTERPEFSIVRVPRDGPREKAFIRMLLGIEPGLDRVAEPMALPVFGRGRALCLLVGDEADEENVRDICNFVTEWCSCQVKAMNPGVDLLMSVDWDGALEGMLSREAESPTPESPPPPSHPGLETPSKKPPSSPKEVAQPARSEAPKDKPPKTLEEKSSPKPQKESEPEKPRKAKREGSKPASACVLDPSEVRELARKPPPALSPEVARASKEMRRAPLGRNIALTVAFLVLVVGAASGVLLLRRRE